MTIRRSERDWGAEHDEDDVAYDDFIDNTWDAPGDAAVDERLLFLNATTVPKKKHDGPVIHPAITDFGPASLSHFLRAEVGQATAERSPGTRKGKQPVRDAEARTSKKPTVSAQDYSKRSSSAKSGGQPNPSPSLQLAKDARLHPRGLKGQEDVSQVGLPSAPQTSPSTASSQRIASRDNTSPRRSRASPGRIRTSHRRMNSQTASRVFDFTQHTQEVRSRIRSEQGQQAGPASPAAFPDGTADETFQHFPVPQSPLFPRRRTTRGNPVDLFESNDSDSDNSQAARSGPGPTLTGEPWLTRLNQGQSALSDSILNDDEDNVDNLGGRFRTLNTDDSDLGSISGEDGSYHGDGAHDQNHNAQIDHNLTRNEAFRDYAALTLDRNKNKQGPYPSLPSRDETAKAVRVRAFSYADIVPADKPQIVARRLKHTENASITPAISFREPAVPGLRIRLRSGSNSSIVGSLSEGNMRPGQSSKPAPKRQVKFLITNDALHRRWGAHYPLTSSLAPPACYTDPNAPPRNAATTTGETVLPFNYDIWTGIVEYLSFEDAKNLRLTCSGLANEIAPLMLHSVVTTFGKSMFTRNPRRREFKKKLSLPSSMLRKYGQEIHKFGISFEYDPMGLAYATAKVTEKQEDAWYGSYRWPVKNYPRFAELQELEDLADNNGPLLKDSLGLLTGASELALSLDSGHGWLNGPDISDLALYDLRRNRVTKVFGPAFEVEDIWHAFGRSEMFKWAQQNSINESLKVLSTRPDDATVRRHIREFQNMIVREYEEFVDEKSQHDFDPFSHTGGRAPIPPAPQPPQPQPPQLVPQLIYYAVAGAPPVQAQAGPPINAHLLPGGILHRPRPNPLMRGYDEDRDDRRKKVKTDRKIPLQFPITFSGYNLAADVGGRNKWIQNKSASPSDYPLIPGHLTEAQVQWLMETAWAQRAFLSAYTTAIITHKQMLSKVHTLTIAKISSGLLPSLAQKEFWTSLSGLKRLKILVSPDWRNEHVPGDKFFSTHMTLSPVTAAFKFAEFLRGSVAKLENLSHLTIGYIGGGENAVGMFARNQHVLPAPVTEDPRIWVTDHVKKPNPLTLLRFDHIRDLTFENCWFSPCMLEAFMERSRDTSLHTLTLDSVSMLSRHSTGIDGHLQTVRNGLRCRFDENDWLHEEVPSSATWTEVLDKITPGATMLERKYAAGMIDKDLRPIPSREFRGNVQKIVLRSCGYAKISGVKGEEFNQNALVMQSSSGMDMGLETRRRAFDRFHSMASEEDDGLTPGNLGTGRWATITRASYPGGPAVFTFPDGTEKSTKNLPVMMSMTDPATGADWFGLGTLTQCVHPVEKRILEQAWGMSFGWGNTIERWASVEDGCFEGGTGRFSGVVE